jgi:hypothetical protein
MQKLKRIIFGLLAFFVSGSIAMALDFTDAELADLNRISRLIGKSLDKSTINELKEKCGSPNVAVAIIAQSALFVDSPRKNKKAFYRAMAIDDYAKREGGKKDMISFAVLQSVLADIDKRSNGDKDDERIITLLAVIEFREKNLWFEGFGSPTSLSRFLRAMYLSSCFGDSGLDAEKIANEIDEQTQKDRA